MKKKMIGGILAAVFITACSAVCGQASGDQKAERRFAPVTAVDRVVRRPVIFEEVVTPLYREIGDFYYASVSTEVSATMSAQSTGKTGASSVSTRAADVNAEGGISGEIKDWGQAVSAGSDVSASLEKIPGKASGSAPGFLFYQWEFYDSEGVRIKRTSGCYASVPEEAEGGYLLIQISVLAANNGWAVSNTASYVPIG